VGTLNEDSPPLDTVRQADEHDPWRVAVDLVESEPVPLEMLPMRIGVTAQILLAPGARPVKILSADPRRAFVTMHGPISISDVRIGRTREECEEVSTTISGGILIYRMTHSGELWARNTHVSETHALNVLTENWSQ
jgi:hypothetical protein